MLVFLEFQYRNLLIEQVVDLLKGERTTLRDNQGGKDKCAKCDGSEDQAYLNPKICVWGI